MFSYDDYKNLINLTIDCGYKPIRFVDSFDRGIERKAIIRHDVDMSPVKALEFANQEAELGVKSTYFVLISSDYYNLMSKNNQDAVNKMLELGHEIGLHYDFTKYAGVLENRDLLIKTLKKELYILENILECEVNSFSWHIPAKSLIGKTLDIEYGGRHIMNAYDRFFFENFKYLSDSEMRWREPVKEIVSSREYLNLQILTHPIWYSTGNSVNAKQIIKIETEKRIEDINNYGFTIYPH